MIDPMSVVHGAKEIAELVKKYNDVPLYQKIVELQGQVVELATERLGLFSKNQELAQKLELKAKTEFRNPYYYQQGDDVPLCPTCYDNSCGEKRIHLTHPTADYMSGHGRCCRVCKQVFVEGPRQTPSAQSRVRHSGWV
jgi:hypothetical protein